MPRKRSTAAIGRPSAEKNRNARELLLNAAVELFALHGIAGTTFTMIAKRVGFTRAMMHYYFKDKERLLDAVFDERFVGFVTHIWEHVQADADPVVSIRGIVERALQLIDEMPWVPPIWVREVLNESGLLRQRMIGRAPIEKMRLLGQAVIREQRAGTLNPAVDPQLAYASFLGLVMLHAATVRSWAKAMDREPLNTETLQRHILALLLDGLRHR